MVAGASSSFTANLSAKSISTYLPPKFLQKSSFQRLSLQDAKRVGERIHSAGVVRIARRGIEIRAKAAAGAAKNIEVEVDKPLDLTLGQKPGGEVVAKSQISTNQ